MAGSPRYVTALISALRLRNAQPEVLQALDDPAYEELRRLLSTLGALAH